LKFELASNKVSIRHQEEGANKIVHVKNVPYFQRERRGLKLVQRSRAFENRRRPEIPHPTVRVRLKTCRQHNLNYCSRKLLSSASEVKTERFGKDLSTSARQLWLRNIRLESLLENTAAP
jgi:hypothetical protein